MSGRIPVEPHFYWSQCLVCHKEDTPSSPLKRCSRCHMAPYCSPNHQRSHWKNHKQLCFFFAETSAHTGQQSFFSDMAGSSQADWNKFSTSSLMHCSIMLGRALSQQETDMFLFPRSCQMSNCHSVTGHPDMVDCLHCLCVSYCSMEHKEKDKDSHALGCNQLKLARLLDRQDALIGVEMTDFSPHQDSKYLGTSKDIMSHVVQMEGARLGLGPLEDVEDYEMDVSDDPEAMKTVMDFASLTNQLSGPLTLLDIGQKFIPNFSTRKHLTIHLAGSSMFEMLGMIKWEYLAHRLPSLDRLDFAFVGPELKEEGKEVERVAHIPTCPGCQIRSKSITYKLFGDGYQEFKRTGGFCLPDILLVQNCGFSEFSDSEGGEGWAEGWGRGLGTLLECGLILAFTSYSKKEAVEDLQRLIKYCGKEEQKTSQRFHEGVWRCFL